MISKFFEEKHPEFKTEFFFNDTRSRYRSTKQVSALSVLRYSFVNSTKAYNRAFPNAKYGSNLDDYAYKRVRGDLNKFKVFFTRLLFQNYNLTFYIDRIGGFWKCFTRGCLME